MINNRQNGRRGRGRGGVRPINGTGGGSPERGNRIDNRARGNAAQLHEKYKTLARDAQTQGDRVMAEYYLQFADHYFRVLSESRNRFDEQRQARGDFSEDEGELDGDGGMDDARDQRFDDQPYEQRPRYEARDRQPQQQRDRQNDRQNDRQGERQNDDRPRRDEQSRDNGQYRETNQHRENNQSRDSGQGNQSNGSSYNGSNRDTRPDQREARPERDARPDREPHRERIEPRAAVAPLATEVAPVVEGEAPRRPRGRPRRVVEDTGVEAPRLNDMPPAFLSEAITVARPAEAEAGVEGEDRPRRRVRRPRADEGAPVEV